MLVGDVWLVCFVEAVREGVSGRLLPAWLQQLGGDVIELLHRLDVENCAETAMETLKAMFKSMAAEELLQNREQLDNRSPLSPHALKNVSLSIKCFFYI